MDAVRARLQNSGGDPSNVSVGDDEPECPPWLEWIWNVYFLLLTRLPEGGDELHPIPLQEIVAYVELKPFTVQRRREMFVDVVLALDVYRMDLLKKRRNAEINRQKAKAAAARARKGR